MAALLFLQKHAISCQFWANLMSNQLFPSKLNRFPSNSSPNSMNPSQISKLRQESLLARRVGLADHPRSGFLHRKSTISLPSPTSGTVSSASVGDGGVVSMNLMDLSGWSRACGSKKSGSRRSQLRDWFRGIITLSPGEILAFAGRLAFFGRWMIRRNLKMIQMGV